MRFFGDFLCVQKVTPAERPQDAPKLSPIFRRISKKVALRAKALNSFPSFVKEEKWQGFALRISKGTCPLFWRLRLQNLPQVPQRPPLDAGHLHLTDPQHLCRPVLGEVFEEPQQHHLPLPLRQARRWPRGGPAAPPASSSMPPSPSIRFQREALLPALAAGGTPPASVAVSAAAMSSGSSPVSVGQLGQGGLPAQPGGSAGSRAGRTAAARSFSAPADLHRRRHPGESGGSPRRSWARHRWRTGCRRPGRSPAPPLESPDSPAGTGPRGSTPRP